MMVPEKDIKIIRKEFDNKNERIPDRIRLGNHFVDDFIFDGNESFDIPINALRVIFNIISIIGNEQFRPDDRPKQLTLFDEEFETENNTFASIKIKNSKISPSGSSKQVVAAYEFLTKFKMGWYKSLNSKGKEIKTFGGLISIPCYDHRGYTTFLISSYWLKKLLVIPEYNYILYNLVYNIRNNKHIIFAIWLSKLPENGTTLRLSTLNNKFDLNYKSANDFCFKFLKPVKISLEKYNDLSFNYRCRRDLISIHPFNTKEVHETTLPKIANLKTEVTRRLNYFKQRYGLNDSDMVQFSYQYRTISQTRELIERSFKEFIKRNRLIRKKSTEFQGKLFLNELQEFMIMEYRKTKVGELIPNGYPIII